MGLRVKKSTGIIVLVLVVALVGFAGLVQYRANQKAALESGEREATVLNVKVIVASEDTIAERVSFVGSIEADETVPIYPKLGDLTIERISVNIGDEVKEGQTLARLDRSLMSTNLEQARQGVGTAQANVRQADSTFETRKRDYERYKSLVTEGVVSRQEFDQVENQYKIAQEQRSAARFQLSDARAALSNVQINMGYHEIKAPVSGVIAERNADPGDKSSPDKAMFVISRQTRLKLTGTVPEAAFMTLQLKAPAVVTAEALPGKTFQASVSRIYPTLDAATRSGRVELGIDSQGILKPGLYAQGTIDMGAHRGLVLPREAVHQLRGSPNWRVFVLSGDHGVEIRPVELGLDLGSNVEILRGVSTEDKIIATRSDRLEEQNIRVEVVE